MISISTTKASIRYIFRTLSRFILNLFISDAITYSKNT
ncbi:Hypothetical protein ETEE_3974 [Edwardsiella anguillarum ET080813]|uniref:Uncharacterized protein n=1 Tax=Edwardsiella anguillarum ET080813 TaxID=667120 RepID=A0A076LVB4_9GAMM|nr:Hypothetical protein ETEE_3974 [Edwardsiella anguillarum ET080813]